MSCDKAVIMKVLPRLVVLIKFKGEEITDIGNTVVLCSNRSQSTIEGCSPYFTRVSA